jgi:heme exporter protein B
LREIWALLEKDIVAELRTKEKFNAILIFAIQIIVVLAFGFTSMLNVMQRTNPQRYMVLSGILWVSFAFAAMLGLNRSFAREKDEGCIDGLLQAPVDRTNIYIGKVISNFIFLAITQFIALLVFMVFFNADIYTKFLQLAAVLFLGDIGLIAIGTLFSMISVNSKTRDLMLPVLMIPVTSPILIWVIGATNLVLDPFSKMEGFSNLLLTLLFVDIMFLVVSYLVFEFVVEE